MIEAKDSRSSPGRDKAFWGRKFIIIVTGASGGIGRGIAVNVSRRVAEGSLVIITGRNTAALEETKRMTAALGRDVSVSVETCDHSRASFGDYQNLLRRASAQVSDPERVVLVHNAATTGGCSDHVVSYDDERKIDDYYHLNLTSVMTLTSAFLQHFDSDSGPSRMIVNISSAAVTLPLQGLGLYCTGKAAREMYMRVVALENPSVTVLNYNPGPVNTAMLGQMRVGSKECVARCEDNLKNGRILTTDETANRLIRILEKGDFKSGDHVLHSHAL